MEERFKNGKRLKPMPVVTEWLAAIVTMCSLLQLQLPYLCFEETGMSGALRKKEILRDI
jgi:hypothetical protein